MATTTRTIAIQYEDFNPTFQWKEDQSSNLLLLHLPEFQKEEMKISYVHSSRVIRVTGEHPISNNKWRRFNKAFPVPDNCNVQKIQAKFQTPTLTITLPKLIPSSSSSSSPIQNIQNQENPLKTQKPADTDPPHRKNQENHIQNQEKPQNKQKDDTDAHTKKQENHIQNQEKAQNKPKDDSDAHTKKQEKQENKQTADNKKQDQLNPNPPQTTQSPASTDDQENDEKNKNENKNKNKKQDEEEELEEKYSKKRKETSPISDRDEEMSKKLRKEEKIMRGYSEGIKEMNYGEKAKQVKKRIMEIGKEISEDKQSLVNIGVAVLVIAALGAYIYASSKD